MEKYLEIASKYGLSGEEALKFAAERLDKDNEREERRLEREKRAHERMVAKCADCPAFIQNIWLSDESHVYMHGDGNRQHEDMEPILSRRHPP